MNFLFANNTGYRNKGCEAIAESVVDGLLRLQDKSVFNVLTDDLSYDSYCTDKTKPVSFISNPFRKLIFNRNISFTPSWWHCYLASSFNLSVNIRQCITAFKEANAVLSLGGDLFSSIYGDLLKQNLAPIVLAGKMKKPVFLMGQSIGPFETLKESNAFEKAMKYVPIVTVRDTFSLSYLERLKLKRSKIHLVADPAFCLEPDMSQLEKIFNSYNIPKNRPLVGLVASQGIVLFSNVDYSQHFQTLKKLIFFIINDLDCHVVLIPHVQETMFFNDDRFICELLYRAVGFSEKVTLMNLNHSAKEIRAIVSKFDLLITERMHAAIAGLSQNVPTLLIGYSNKAQGLCAEVYNSHCVDDFLIPVKNLGSSQLNYKVKKLYNNREKIVDDLKKVVPTIKDKAALNFTLITDFLKDQ